MAEKKKSTQYDRDIDVTKEERLEMIRQRAEQLREDKREEPDDRSR